MADELEAARTLAADRLQEVATLRAQKETLMHEVDRLRFEVRRPAHAHHRGVSMCRYVGHVD